VAGGGQGSDNGRDVARGLQIILRLDKFHISPLDRCRLEAVKQVSCSLSPILTLKADLQGCWGEVAVEVYERSKLCFVQA
jgi:hypothetical protein